MHQKGSRDATTQDAVTRGPRGCADGAEARGPSAASAESAEHRAGQREHANLEGKHLVDQDSVAVSRPED